MSLSESVREFHVDGATQAKGRPPKVVSLNRSVCGSPLSAERRCCRPGTFDVRGVQRSDKSSGAMMCRHL